MSTVKRLLFLFVALAAINLGSVRADQPHMRRALEHLRAARAELQRAEHNKAGWPQRALNNVERTIADTESGMKAASR
jgi:hypothetical protein